MEEVTAIKKNIDALRIKRARLQERLDTDKAEKQRLLEEAQRLGVKDPSKLTEWLEEQQKVFDAAKEKILKLLQKAEGG
jgi:DNA-binding SARP family transcriptional activator